MYTQIITKENFEREIMQEDKPILLDFWASWCAPCRMLAPIIDDIAKEEMGVKIAKINVDEQQELAKLFRIMSIPTLVLIQEGKVVSTLVGVQPKSIILEMLKKQQQISDKENQYVKFQS